MAFFLKKSSYRICVDDGNDYDGEGDGHDPEVHGDDDVGDLLQVTVILDGQHNKTRSRETRTEGQFGLFCLSCANC